jgi:hypothetical protein
VSAILKPEESFPLEERSSHGLLRLDKLQLWGTLIPGLFLIQVLLLYSVLLKKI